VSSLAALISGRAPQIDGLRAALTSPWFLRRARLILIAGAVFGVISGVWAIYVHLGDIFFDAGVYYQAGARLNAGQPLYPPSGADFEVTGSYLYPPLLAILFRPLALLPYPVAVALFGAAMAGTCVVLIRRVWHIPNAPIFIGLLGLPIGYSLALGQAHILGTLLVSLATPASVALAANLKVFAALVVLYWVGRRDWRSVGRVIAWGLALLVFQFVLEPTNTLAYITFLTTNQVGPVYNLSIYGISPILWAIAAPLGAIAVIALARTRYGWAAAVVYSTAITPRLIVYTYMGLLAALRPPPEDEVVEPAPLLIGEVRQPAH
jgi:alpha-1,2-mannosyltransferase